MPRWPSDWPVRYVVPALVAVALALAWAPGVWPTAVRTAAVLSVALLAASIVAAAINASTAPRLEPGNGRVVDRPVSLLLAVDPDCGGLVDTLPALLAGTSAESEILIVERRPSNETAALLELLDSVQLGRVRVLRRRVAPPGWTWRNHARHRLARAATGDVLIFCDPATSVHGDAVAATLGLLDRTGADAVTAFPRPRLAEGLKRSALLQLGPWLAATLLPLAWVPRTRSPYIAAGTRRWFAITRDAYDAIGGYAAVRHARRPETALCRILKASGLRLVVALAPGVLSVTVSGTPVRRPEEARSKRRVRTRPRARPGRRRAGRPR